MPVEDYAAQPFIQKHELFNYIAKICLAKSDEDYAGFSRIYAAAVSGRTISLYGSNLGNLKGLHHTSDNQAVERLMHSSDKRMADVTPNSCDNIEACHSSKNKK